MNINIFMKKYMRNIAGRLAFRLYNNACITESDIDETMFDNLITLSDFCSEDVADDVELLDVWNDVIDYFAHDFRPPWFFAQEELTELKRYILNKGFEIDDVLDTIKDSPTYYL